MGMEDSKHFQLIFAHRTRPANRGGRKYPRPWSPYPIEYNPRVHGPYDPARYYGADKRVNFWDMRPKDVKPLIFSHDKTVTNYMGIVERCLGRFAARNYRFRVLGARPLLQLQFWMMFWWEVARVNFTRKRCAHVKYH